MTRTLLREGEKTMVPVQSETLGAVHGIRFALLEFVDQLLVGDIWNDPQRGGALRPAQPVRPQRGIPPCGFSVEPV